MIIDDASTSSEDRSKARYELYLLSETIHAGQERLATFNKKTDKTMAQSDEQWLRLRDKNSVLSAGRQTGSADVIETSESWRFICS